MEKITLLEGACIATAFVLTILWLEMFFASKNKRNIKFEKISRKQYEIDFKNGFEECRYEEIRYPKRSTSGSAGYDFFSPIDFSLEVGQSIKISTGIKARMNKDIVLLCMPRSSHGTKYRLQLDNTIGVIDSDYYNSEKNEGHILLKVTNDGKEGKTLTIRKGEAFAQGIFIPYYTTNDDRTKTKREGGFGSTSIK